MCEARTQEKSPPTLLGFTYQGLQDCKTDFYVYSSNGWGDIDAYRQIYRKSTYTIEIQTWNSKRMPGAKKKSKCKEMCLYGVLYVQLVGIRELEGDLNLLGMVEF